MMYPDNKLLAYLIRVGDATSQWVNVVLLWSQNPNESISGRAYRLQDKSRAWAAARVIIDTVIFWEDKHCKLSYLADYRRAKEYIESM